MYRWGIISALKTDGWPLQLLKNISQSTLEICIERSSFKIDIFITLQTTEKFVSFYFFTIYIYFIAEKQHLSKSCSWIISYTYFEKPIGRPIYIYCISAILYFFRILSKYFFYLLEIRDIVVKRKIL